MNPLGFSFAPGSGDVRNGGAPTPTQGITSPVQTLNLNLPTQAAPGALAPQSLLQAGGASATGMPDTQLLQLLMRMFLPQMQQSNDVNPDHLGQQPQMASPTAHVIAGELAPGAAQGTPDHFNIPAGNGPISQPALPYPVAGQPAQMPGSGAWQGGGNLFGSFTPQGDANNPTPLF